MSAKKLSILFLVIANLSNNASAKTYPKIYPFVPVTTQSVYSDVERFTEDKNFEKNIFRIYKQKLTKGNAQQQPWTSTYWPLNQGLIANRYQESSLLNPFLLHRRFSWKANYRRFSKKRKELMKEWRELDNEDLEELSPAEKYDLLMGDTKFTLTYKMLDYTKRWGEKKEYGFLKSFDIISGRALKLAQQWVDDKVIDYNGNVYKTVEQALPNAIARIGGLTEIIAQKLHKKGDFVTLEAAFPEAKRRALRSQSNYVLEPKNGIMALWEGLCHGWATASIHLPRPTKYVDFRIANGKRLRFFPDDIKALASLLWANSTIQTNDKLFIKNPDNSTTAYQAHFMQGLRCNNKDPEKDEWGRFYDAKPDQYSGKIEPRCVGVHPAKWHLALVNIIGKQKRSFVVERKVKAAIDNHPLKGYSMKFFDPYDGEYGTLVRSTRMLTKDDQFYKFRNPDTKLLVGVKLKMTYVDWKEPDGEDTDSIKDDDLKSVEMLYDLEMNADGDIIGGQWRTTEVGAADFLGDRTQPDFFWVITKHWKKFFPENTSLSKWSNTRLAPPKDWNQASMNSINFSYQYSYEFNNHSTCVAKHKENGKRIFIPCEFQYPRPQPLVNVVNKLIELSRR